MQAMFVFPSNVLFEIMSIQKTLTCIHIVPIEYWCTQMSFAITSFAITSFYQKLPLSLLLLLKRHSGFFACLGRKKFCFCFSKLLSVCFFPSGLNDYFFCVAFDFVIFANYPQVANDIKQIK